MDQAQLRISARALLSAMAKMMVRTVRAKTAPQMKAKRGMGLSLDAFAITKTWGAAHPLIG